MTQTLTDLCAFADGRVAVADKEAMQMNDWTLVRAADFIDFNPRESLPRNTMAKKVAMDRLQPFTRDIPGFEVAPFNGGSKFRNGDTLMARITPCLENGKTAQVSMLDENEVGFGSTEFIVLRAKPGISDKNFIYYLSMSPLLRDKAIKSMVGSSGRQRVQQGVLDNTEFYVPPLPEQVEIGRTLRALDDKIANNTAINHHLEQMAQAIFKSWFVDFEPFGGEMPSDWQEGTLGEILQSIKQPVKAGERPELPYVSIDTIPMNSLALTDFRPNEEAQSSLLTFAKDDILIGAMRVYFHRVSIAPFDGITRTTCFVLRPNDKAYLEYALLLCNEDSTIDYAQNTSKGSTMPYAVWDNGLANLPIAIPSHDVAREFSNTMRPIIERLRDSLFEVRNLSSLRDTLLPQLMSGELSIDDIGNVK